MKITLIGAGGDLGVNCDGAKEGAVKLLNEYQDKIMIYQDENYVKSIDSNDLRKNESEIIKFNSKLYNIVDSEIKKGNVPITVGGDHSVSIASALASRNNKKVGIIWIDAHSDFNTFKTTVTGNIHGLPLATIVGYGNDELREFCLGECINPKNTVIIGARSIDDLEYENLSLAGVKYYTTDDIKKIGIENIVKEAFSISLNDTLGVHISCDLDIVDPNYAPGVSVPEINGISEDDILKLTDEVLKYKDSICSYDLVEFNPYRDTSDKTLNLAKNILEKVKQKMEN